MREYDSAVFRGVVKYEMWGVAAYLETVDGQ